MQLPEKIERIGILCALDKEAALIRENLENRENSELFGVPISKGTYEGKTVIVAVGGMGTVAAAAAAQLLIAQYELDVLLFSGIAGSLNPMLDTGDMVIGGQLKYLETNTAIIAECNPWLEVFPSHPALVAVAQKVLQTLGYSQMPSVGQIYAVEESQRSQYVEQQEQQFQRVLEGVRGAEAYRGTRYVTGVIATSDQFNTEPQVLEATRREQHADCEEMEGVAAAHVAHKCGVPFLAIRCMSNVCGEAYDALDNAQDRMQATARAAARVALGVVTIL